jgi:hypothetical protein
MAKLTKPIGATSQILEVFIQDSESTTGAGKTGLAHDSASLTAYYHRNTAAAAVQISLVDMTVGTFTSSGFKEVDSVNLPGFYQLCVPNAAYASGADSFSVMLKGASGMAPLPLEVQLGIDANVVTWLGVAPLALTAQKVNSVDDHLDDEIAAILAQVLPINAGNVTYTAPVNPNTGNLTLIRGDDYTEETGRTLPAWSSSDWTPYNLLTAEGVTFRAKSKHYGTTVFEKAVEVVSATQVRLELTSAETATFGIGRDAMRFDIEAELAGGEIVTLVQGTIHVLEDVR